MMGRRSELVSLAKARKLSLAESDELKTILQKELQRDFATGKIGLLAFLILRAIIKTWIL